MAITDGVGEGRGCVPDAGVLALPHPDWLYHHLRVSGDPAAVAAFRAAAAGPGVIPWMESLAAAAGLTIGARERLSAHGLRAGFVTEAYKAGARDEQIMAHTRHRDLRTMRGYVRRAKLLAESPSKLLGL